MTLLGDWLAIQNIRTDLYLIHKPGLVPEGRAGMFWNAECQFSISDLAASSSTCDNSSNIISIDKRVMTLSWVEQSKHHCSEVEATVEKLTAQTYITWSIKIFNFVSLPKSSKRAYRFNSAIVLIGCWLSFSLVKFDFARLFSW